MAVIGRLECQAVSHIRYFPAQQYDWVRESPELAYITESSRDYMRKGRRSNSWAFHNKICLGEPHKYAFRVGAPAFFFLGRETPALALL
jgi:hypothetical protein